MPTVTPGSLDLGTEIFSFSSNAQGDLDIYLADPAGEHKSRLTASYGSDWSPVWSPRGDSIAFVSERDGYFQIYTMAPDGTEQDRLETGFESWHPTWSPDGSKIAFAGLRWDKYDLFIMNADGSGLQQVTFNPGNNQWPSWSPNGQELAFSGSGLDGVDQDWDIYVVGTGGGNLRRLTNTVGEDWGPVWSPDGARIAFTSNRDGNHEIYIMNKDGSGLWNVTSSLEDEFYPSWSSNGRGLLLTACPFTAFGRPDCNVYSLSFATLEIVQLTDEDAEAEAGGWRPRSDG